mmetsp:Transcript_20987/g.31654  ORF Transcript_20987/g.31654 Transcript_20987/m.31654 type:complete len:97 (+) Transcript_20987:257-547(+)
MALWSAIISLGSLRIHSSTTGDFSSRGHIDHAHAINFFLPTLIACNTFYKHSIILRLRQDHVLIGFHRKAGDEMQQARSPESLRCDNLMREKNCRL